jgi:signal transduction histidine kinase
MVLAKSGLQGAAIIDIPLVEAGKHRAKESAALIERERFAAELHSNLAQTLCFLNLF